MPISPHYLSKAAPMQDFAFKILLVEDNDDLREATSAFLQQKGHYVRSVPMAEEINDMTGGFVPDVYVIDLNLPDEDGLSLTRRLRDTHPDAGIVITTARSQIGDKVLGYESGADLYLTKPVHPNELMAGITSLAKRLKYSPISHNHDLQLNVGRLQLNGPGGSAELTAADSQLLSAFARAPGQTLERWQLAEIIGTGGEPPSSATIEMRIARLRKKLAAAGAASPYIKALHKVGYKLCDSVILQ
ncbi:response regulator transcription factor [Nitrosomonas sp.]|uniref:response regulator transcription factor n=1 Tax=Nitrosomonas sp. TaxID=42353 RepID=UPI0025D80EE2|nr:response regulator transcription factor [Nitrosomonas sp.]MCC6915930.1 response regulator transcription factor [Nitrosomonas sp.]